MMHELELENTIMNRDVSGVMKDTYIYIYINSNVSNHN